MTLIDLKAKLRGIVANDLKRRLAVVFGKLQMMVVIIQGNAVSLQLLSHRVRLLRKLDQQLLAGRVLHRQHADSQIMASEGLAVGNNLVIIILQILHLADRRELAVFARRQHSARTSL